MQRLKWIFQLSRPRFWFYVLGPVLLAIAATYGTDLVLRGKATSSGYELLQVGLVILFFTLPANLLIYGLNDLFDYETDKHNTKKKSYEILLEPKNRPAFLRLFLLIISVTLVPLVLVLVWRYVPTSQSFLFDPESAALWSLLGFVFFGVGYSVPPIRAKVRPFLDSFFNILYVFPGLVMYGLLTKTVPPSEVLLAATLWVMAMHAFSAVPDIAADKKADLKTIATVLGRNTTILLCAAFYVLSAQLMLSYLGWLAVVGGLVYVGLMILAGLSQSDDELFRIYKLFPYVNVAFGFVLFWYVLWPNL